MVSWVLAILGVIYGLLSHEVETGLILAIVGYLIGRWFEKRSATAPAAPVRSLSAEMQELKQRVSQLEAELAQLKAIKHSTSVENPAEQTTNDDVLVASAIMPAQTHLSMDEPVKTQAANELETTLATLAPRPTPARPTPKPATPNLIEQGINAAKEWLLGGNTVVRLGMIILFFGVSFLLKFAADNQLLPIELRLAGLSLGAAVIFVIGWHLRETRRSYALIMQGGALGLLYFTIYGALKLYHLLPASLAFPLLVLLGVAAALLSIRQDASALAVMGILGGFLAPILTSDGSGNYVLLFSYFAVLNAGIFAIAWFKAWRLLNLLGFVFTYVIATAWGLFDYRSEMRASVQPFVVIYWLFFAGISTLYAIHRSHNLRSIVDDTLVFGTPIVTLAIQAQLMHGTEYGLSVSALIGAGYYLAIATWLHGKRDQQLQLFFESQLAIGVLLATLAIPFAFDGNITAAMWAVEGACVVWVSLRQQKKLALGFGLILQFAAGLAVISASDYYTSTAILNGVYLADLLLALSGLFCAWQLHESQSDWALKQALIQAGWLLGAWGLLWWGYANWSEAQRFLERDAGFNLALLLAVATAALFQQLFLRGIWRNARFVAIALAPILLYAAIELFPLYPHFLSLWAWPIVLLGLFALLYQQDQSEQGCETWQHVSAAWLTWGIFVNETYYMAYQNIHNDVFSLSLFAIVACVAIVAVRQLAWPIKPHWRAYWVYGTAPVSALLFAWSFYSALSGGHSALPILNALDSAQIAVFAALIYWARLALFALKIPRIQPALFASLGAAIFVWLNAMLLRTLHHWQGVQYNFDALRASTQVQMSLSIFWALIALALMFAATRYFGRVLWLAGASLLGIVVIKLFALDLSHISGIERIISFIGVGLLLLMIGYLAPIPPQQDESILEKLNNRNK
ncbi:DUF2339 domain-containing protein [Chitinibacter sp. SCUT-21]|uniref:DUF2339 domain-containing protein n=1 Tax=Chitinibacter sp. SCUT-21 TaxID=2970891 RepID=UPI0035A65E7A